MENNLAKQDIGVGFDQIDGEHRVQVGLLSALRDAVTKERAETEVNEILEQLVDYTKVHFMSEELLMRLYQYPHYEAHVADGTSAGALPERRRGDDYRNIGCGAQRADRPYRKLRPVARWLLGTITPSLGLNKDGWVGTRKIQSLVANRGIRETVMPMGLPHHGKAVVSGAGNLGV